MDGYNIEKGLATAEIIAECSSPFQKPDLYEIEYFSNYADKVQNSSSEKKVNENQFDCELVKSLESNKPSNVLSSQLNVNTLEPYKQGENALHVWEEKHEQLLEKKRKEEENLLIERQKNAKQQLQEFQKKRLEDIDAAKKLTRQKIENSQKSNDTLDTPEDFWKQVMEYITKSTAVSTDSSSQAFTTYTSSKLSLASTIPATPTSKQSQSMFPHKDVSRMLEVIQSLVSTDKSPKSH